jgi:hypothetical protein
MRISAEERNATAAGQANPAAMPAAIPAAMPAAMPTGLESRLANKSTKEENAAAKKAKKEWEEDEPLRVAKAVKWQDEKAALAADALNQAHAAAAEVGVIWENPKTKVGLYVNKVNKQRSDHLHNALEHGLHFTGADSTFTHTELIDFFQRNKELNYLGVPPPSDDEIQKEITSLMGNTFSEPLSQSTVGGTPVIPKEKLKDLAYWLANAAPWNSDETKRGVRVKAG